MTIRSVIRPVIRDVIRPVIGGLQQETDSILALFAGGEQGGYYDPSDLSTVFQDAAMTTPAVADDPVGAIMDKSGNNNHATQSSGSARPILRNDGGLWYLDFDGVDDILQAPNAVTIKEGFYWGAGLNITTGGGIGQMVFCTSTNFDAVATSRDACGIYQRSDSVKQIFSAMRIGVGTQFVAFLNSAFTIGQPFIAEAFHENNVLTASNAISTATVAADDNNTSPNGPITIGSKAAALRFYGGVCLMRETTGSEKLTVRQWIAERNGVVLP